MKKIILIALALVVLSSIGQAKDKYIAEANGITYYLLSAIGDPPKYVYFVTKEVYSDEAKENLSRNQSKIDKEFIKNIDYILMLYCLDVPNLYYRFESADFYDKNNNLLIESNNSPTSSEWYKLKNTNTVMVKLTKAALDFVIEEQKKKSSR